MNQVNTEKVIEELKTQGYSKITVKNWNQDFRIELGRILYSQGFKFYQFYRMRDEQDQYVIVLEGITVPLELEQIYAKKSNFLHKLLPLILVIIVLASIVYFIKTYSQDRAYSGLMTSTVVIIIPIILGALLQYFALVQKPSRLRNTGWLIAWSGLAGILAFGALFLGEGTICLIILSPLIFVELKLGTVLMQAFCRYLWKPSFKTYSLALFPLLLFFVLPDFSRNYYGQTQRELIIHAPQDKVFKAINQIGQVRPEEVPDNFIFMMGFPKPTFGMTEQRKERMVRTIQWERGVQFEERVTASHAPYLLSWIYQFSPTSFPKGSMDDHVKIGGPYFDLLKTDYQLEKLDNNTTKLILTIDYRLSTEYNWYSKLWVNYVLNEFSDVVMQIHKQRLEHK